MCCGTRFLKVILFTINFLFLLVGIALLIVGIWTAVDTNSFNSSIRYLSLDIDIMFSKEMVQDSHIVSILSYVLIAVGIFIFIFAFSGCWGVIMENRFFLIGYVVVLSLLLLTKIICIIILTTDTMPVLDISTRNSMNVLYDSYKGTLGTAAPNQFDNVSKAFDRIMVAYSCCGLNGMDDFKNSTLTHFWHANGRQYQVDGKTHSGDEVKLPVACCAFTDKTFYPQEKFDKFHDYMVDVNCPLTRSTANNKGCVTTIEKYLVDYEILFIVIPAIIMVVELFGIIFSSCLAYRLKKEYESYI